MRALAEVPAIFLRQGGGGYHPVAAYQLGGWHLINILVLSSLCAESLWPRTQMMHKMSTERARDVKQALRGVLRVHSEFRADPNQLVRAASDLELMNMKSKSMIQGQIGTYR
jgi:hypothetical protein